METTTDAVLGGAVRLCQPRHGYRAGLDAALLAAACGARPGERVLEAGCGVGAALLAAAVRAPQAAFTGVERDEAACRLAADNVALNGLGDRVKVLAGDVGRPFSELNLETFDSAMANPPFFDDPKALRGPAPAKRAAWIAEEGLAAWTVFMLAAVRPGGAVTLIHRADRLDDLLSLLAPKAGSLQIRPVHPFADAPAGRVLVRARKGGRAPLRLLPALIVHGRGAETKHTDRVEAVLRGEADLPWT